MKSRERARESTEGGNKRAHENRESGRALGRRRLLQALGGAAGLTAVGLHESTVVEVARAQSDGSQQQKIAADDGDPDDSFGQSVSVSDDGATALIAAFEDDDPNGDRAGSAYVFTESDGSWSQQQKLTASDGDIDDGFGVSVSLSDDGTTALIGAADIDERNDDDETAPGSAYVFTKSGGNWSQQQKLTATDRDTADVFGRAVSLSDDGTTALIGASGNDSAYIFTESGGSWSQQQKLTASDGDGSGLFGNSVSLSDDGTTALIGAFESAFIFTKSGGRWDQQQKLTAANGTGNFGSVTTANDGTTVLIGVLSDENSNGDRAGSAFVFTKANGSWSQQQKLIATDGDSQDNFGRSVSLSADGTTAVIGADSDGNSNGDRAGSTYVFNRSDGSWSQQQKLTASDGGSNDFFGRSVSVSDDGTTALIGAAFASANGSSAGAGYVFTLPQSQPESEPQLEIGATVKQSGSPGRQAQVQYTLSSVSGQSSVTLELTSVPQQLTVNQSASTTSGTFESNGQRLVFSSPNEELTPTIVFNIAESADSSATFSINGELLDETSSVTDSVRVEVGNISIVDEFDEDGNGDISITELGQAGQAFASGELTITELGKIGAAFAS